MSAANWAKATSTTTGTGDLTLSGVTGYPTFNDVYGTSRRFPYAILDNSNPPRPIEAGIGYLSASTTLVREKVLSTYSASTFDDISPSAVSLAAGTYNIVTPPLAEGLLNACKSGHRLASPGYQKISYSQHYTIHNTSSTGYTAVANRLIFTPFWLTSSVECDALAVRCGTGVASTNVRIGIYDVTPEGHPGKLLGETGSLATTTSSTDVIGTLGATVRLQPGWYFTALVTDGAPALGRMTSGGECFTNLGPTSGNLMSMNVAFFGTHTFGALPNPAPTTSLTTVAAGGATPAIGVRFV
jgi:hypothetical protein